MGEKPTTPHICSPGNPPHSWEITKDDKGQEKKKTPAETKQGKAGRAGDIRDKIKKKEAKAVTSKMPPPACAEEKSELGGVEFESKSIAENEKKKPIESTEVHYHCTKCAEKTEVDIIFEDGQVAESQSETARNYDTDKRKSKQAKMLGDNQRHINEQKGTSHKPMAKFDKGNVQDEALAKKAATRRGMIYEGVG
jgi:hypothetical protein